jgi:hypothetical protein
MRCWVAQRALGSEVLRESHSLAPTDHSVSRSSDCSSKIGSGLSRSYCRVGGRSFCYRIWGPGPLYRRVSTGWLAHIARGRGDYEMFRTRDACFGRPCHGIAWLFGALVTYHKYDCGHNRNQEQKQREPAKLRTRTCDSHGLILACRPHMDEPEIESSLQHRSVSERSHFVTD